MTTGSVVERPAGRSPSRAPGMRGGRPLPQEDSGERAGLLLIAHGSPDSRHAAGVRRLAAAVAARTPARVAIGYLDHHAPSPIQAANGLLAQGVTRAVALPLFTVVAFHMRVDVPAALEASRLAGLPTDLAQPGIAGSPRLVAAALAEQLSGRTPAILLAAGSTDRHACARLAQQVAELAADREQACEAAFMAGGPGLAQVAARFAQPPVVVPFVISEGIFHDRMAAEAAGLGLRFSRPTLVDVPAVARLAAESAEIHCS
ncbi:MAG: sirohydrochlorin chelatase [Candidatus Nanopelagicales bacterium]